MVTTSNKIAMQPGLHSGTRGHGCHVLLQEELLGSSVRQAHGTRAVGGETDPHLTLWSFQFSRDLNFPISKPFDEGEDPGAFGGNFEGDPCIANGQMMFDEARSGCSQPLQF